MTVSSTVRTATINGDGTTGPFQFVFRFLANSDVQVIKTNSSGIYNLVEGSDYTMNGAGSYSGGLITPAAPLLIGESLTLSRVLPILQSIDLSNQGSLFPETLEMALDRLTMMAQQFNVAQITAATGAGNATTLININAASGPVNVDIKNLTDVMVSKDDSSANLVTIIDSSGNSVCRGGLNPLIVQDEIVHLVLFGTNWKRVS